MVYMAQFEMEISQESMNLLFLLSWTVWWKIYENRSRIKKVIGFWRSRKYCHGKPLFLWVSDIITAQLNMQKLN